MISLNASQALAKVFLQNNYLKPIEYVEETASIASKMVHKQLGNGARVELQTRRNARDFFQPLPQQLSIRSIGGRNYDLSYLFASIKNEEAAHPNSHAII